MKVVATKKGYFDLRIREEGEEFNVPQHLFSKNWMKSLEAPAAPAAPAEGGEQSAAKGKKK